MKKRPTFLLLCIFLMGCSKQKPLSLLGEKYSVQELNIFYELCCGERNNGKQLLRKWNKDIYFYLEGDTLQGDRAMVLEFAATVNALDLPIKIREARTIEQANLFIFSGSEEEMGLTPPKRGATKVYYNEGRINNARIGISNTIKNEDRTGLLMHEFMHALGFASHATRESNSVSFAIANSQSRLGPNEKSALRILYEPVWPDDYNVDDVENEFGSILWHIDGQLKFKEYLIEHKPDSSIINEILQHGLIQPYPSEEPQIFKHSSSLKIVLKGKVPIGLADSLSLLINEINKVTPHFNLGISNNPMIKYGILFDFIEDSADETWFSLLNNITNENKFNTIVRTDISIHYGEDSQNFTKKLGTILFQAISLKDYNFKVDPFEITKDKVFLKPRYKELLKIYYAHELPHNFTKSKMEEVLKNYKANYSLPNHEDIICTSRW